MSITLAFDVYGTLIDTAGITTTLEKFVGEQARSFSRLWRDKQLEYSFRRGLMQNYHDFSICTKNALDYACTFFRTEIGEREKAELMEGYRMLPTFPDVEEGLENLKSAGFRMFDFSNGREEDVSALLRNATIDTYFDGVVSVDEIKSFKPNPAVYCHFLRRSGSTGSEAWLISSNPFDVIGAISAGMRAAWIRRTADIIFDPWDIEPTITVSGIGGLQNAIRDAQ